MKPRIFYLYVFLIFLFACHQQSKQIAKTEDYAKYLQNTSRKPQHIIVSQQEISFWEGRIQKAGRGHLYLMKIANQLELRFKKSGNIQDLINATKLLEEANKMLKGSEVSVLHALALNCVTRHEFKQASGYLAKAGELGANKAVTLLLQSDVQLELGNVLVAKNLLNQYKYPKEFDFLIRQSKMLDHEGKLDEAIQAMEKAWEVVKAYQAPEYHTWTLTSLADYYGHSGQITKAYQAYLSTLKIDPNHDYALKGLAWIAFSHDKNSIEAKKILNFIRQRNQSPDILLKLAEIAEFEGNEKEKLDLLTQFKKEVNKPEYGEMYNKYLITLALEEVGDTKTALQIAEKEIKNRPTAQSYDLLAWTYYHQKDYAKAYEIAQKYIIGKSSEPDILMHLGFLHQALGKKAVAKQYFQEALEAEFELGPIESKKIKIALNKIDK